MTTITPPPFQWSEVKPELRSWLQNVTHQIQGHVHAIGSDLVRVGLLLRDVRERLPRGQFVAWVNDHFAFSLSHAYRLLQVGDAFQSHVSQIEKFEPSALYVLADPRVPQSAREFAVEQAAEGQRITRKAAAEILDAYRPVVMTAAEERTLSDARKQIPDSPKPADDDPAKDDAEIGRLLRQAVGHFGMVHLSRSEEDSDGDETAVAITGMGGGQRTATAVGSLLYVLREALGVGPKKLCKRVKCDRGPQPLSCFAKDKSNPDGLSRYCRTCEKKRMSAIIQRRRAKRQADRRAAAQPVPA